jgi:hypothetical protein
MQTFRTRRVIAYLALLAAAIGPAGASTVFSGLPLPGWADCLCQSLSDQPISWHRRLGRRLKHFPKPACLECSLVAAI